MRLNDHQVRKLSFGLRRELFSYVPRQRAEGMTLDELREHLSLFCQEDLSARVEGALRAGYVPYRGKR